MEWGIIEFGYEPKTTFWQDFSIADMFGIDAIKDTYNRAFKEWKNDYIYLTELIMVLNWKIYQYYEKNDEYARIYNDLWVCSDEYAVNHLKDEELSYYIRTTD